VPEAGIVVEALPVPPSARSAGYNSDHLLDASLLSKELKVRNWRPGDRFCPAHTKSPKKIKELLQERHVSGEARKVWPVVANGNEIIWVRGFPVPTALRAKESGEAIFIRDRVLERT
jgi:tRNA(Ile)-lysidine synthase